MVEWSSIAEGTRSDAAGAIDACRAGSHMIGRQGDGLNDLDRSADTGTPLVLPVRLTLC
jgi:hypothetical protein